MTNSIRNANEAIARLDRERMAARLRECRMTAWMWTWIALATIVLILAALGGPGALPVACGSD